MGVKRNLDSAGMSEPNDNITEDEAALYDRQIRLWGVDCQKRIRETRVLMIGLNGVGIEVAKNLALSGVKCITLMDSSPVKTSDYSAQFFVVGAEGKTRAEASKAPIQELNPNVKVTVDDENLESKNSRFLSDYDLVCATDLPLNVLLKVNKMCREHKVQFYCAETWGMYGYCFMDLQSHSHTTTLRVVKDCQGDLKKEQPSINRMEYCPLGLALGVKVDDKDENALKKKVNKVFILQHIMNNYREVHGHYPLPEDREAAVAELKNIRSTVTKNLGYDEAKISDDMLSGVFGELSPVCAVVGGILANDIIKVISRKGLPINNFFVFNGEDCMGGVETVTVKD